MNQVNPASDLLNRLWEQKVQNEKMFAPDLPSIQPPEPDPEWHAGTGRGAPVAWLMIVLILAVVACSLGGLLLNEWLAAGTWLR